MRPLLPGALAIQLWRKGERRVAEIPKVMRNARFTSKEKNRVHRRLAKIDNGAGGSRATWTGRPERVGEPGGESINKKHGCELRIGISGWRGKFYPKTLAHRREQEFAAGVFSSVEINGSFYSLQRPSSYRRWYSETPENFLFAVKGKRLPARDGSSITRLVSPFTWHYRLLSFSAIPFGR